MAHLGASTAMLSLMSSIFNFYVTFVTFLIINQLLGMWLEVGSISKVLTKVCRKVLYLFTCGSHIKSLFDLYLFVKEFIYDFAYPHINSLDNLYPYYSCDSTLLINHIFIKY